MPELQRTKTNMAKHRQKCKEQNRDNSHIARIQRLRDTTLYRYFKINSGRMMQTDSSIVLNENS